MPDKRVVCVFTYGQSNAHAGGLRRVARADRLATREKPNSDRALMCNTGLLGADGEEFDESSITDLVAAEEDPERGESGGLSFMRYATRAEDAAGLPPNTYLYRTFGRGGTAIGKLRRGGVFYRHVPATLRQLKSIAERRREELHFPAFIFRQGEADASRETKPRRYRKAMAAIVDALAEDVREIIGQVPKPWMLLCVLSAPNQLSQATSEIAWAQMELVNAATLPIVPSICPYWMNGDYGFVTGQTAHWKPLAKAFIVEYEARALRILMEAVAVNPDIRLGDPVERRVFDGETWKTQLVPFETAPRTDPSSIVRTENRIVGKVFFAEGGLHIFTGFRAPARHHGFAWSGTENIVAVSTENSSAGSWWSVELDGWSGSGGVLSYAGTVTSPSIEDDGPSCHGDVFDNCREISLATGLPLRSGMLPWRARIT
jgi:hypothetical protein